VEEMGGGRETLNFFKPLRREYKQRQLLVGTAEIIWQIIAGMGKHDSLFTSV
jgi:hypothetical protein